MYKKYFKRLLDIIFSLLLLIILFSLFIIVGIICKGINGKVFFLQKRDGLNKRSFIIYKFMSLKDMNGTVLERSTKTTRLIRMLGLDELPQLINILKGDMSFIGPRPFITDEELPSKPSEKIYSVRPGVVSLAVSKGRWDVSYENRLKHDEQYTSNVTLKQDIIILFKTIGVILGQLRGDVWKK